MQGSQFLFKTEKIEDCRQGKAQILSNIEVVEKIAKFMATTLGPYGLDKLFYGESLTISNDGATILEKMNFSHPIAQLIANLSKSQDNEVGDGTTSVVLLTGAILSSLKEFIEKDYTVGEIRCVLNICLLSCLKELDKIKLSYSDEKLIKVAETCLVSKNVRNDRRYFAEMLVDILKNKHTKLNIIKLSGGALKDSMSIEGVAFEKTFTYAGYDQQPKKIENPIICCLDFELEWKSEKENGEIRVNTVEEYQKVVDAEFQILQNKLDAIIEAGANVVLSSKSIGDLATQYFASKGVFSAGRVGDLETIIKAFGGKINTSVKNVLVGKADLFEEKQCGNTRYNYFYKKEINVKTLILRGPGDQVVDELERAVHDAVCVLKKAVDSKGIVVGGGATEMKLSAVCRNHYKEALYKDKFLYKAISLAFEKLPMQLAENFGIDPITNIQKLRMKHFEGSEYHGMSITGPTDMKTLGVFEPLEVKKNMIKAAFSCVDTILTINGTLIASNQITK